MGSSKMFWWLTVGLCLICRTCAVQRVRNYASNECGAKVIAANQGAEGTSRILNEMVDEYLLNPCKSPIWFVIELCDFLQPHLLELANYELFSSTPRGFSVLGSENYPTNEWITLGSFEADDIRVIQRFELTAQSQFLKYIKIVINSHHGKEHYCPLSVVRVFGTSMLEELDAIEGGATSEKKFEFHEEMIAETTSSSSSSSSSSLSVSDNEDANNNKRINTIGSAHEVVMAVVRRAAMALSRFSLHNTSSNSTEKDLIDESSRKVDVEDVYRLSLNCLKLMPFLEEELSRCKDCVQYEEKLASFTPSSSTNSLTFNNTSPNKPYCDYLKLMLGLETYVILCEEKNKDPYLRFRCPLVTYYLNYTLPSELIFEENLLPSYPWTRPTLHSTVHDPPHQAFSHHLHEVTPSTTASYDSEEKKTETSKSELSPTSVLEETISSLTSILVDPLLNGKNDDNQVNTTSDDMSSSDTLSSDVPIDNAESAVNISETNNKVLNISTESLHNGNESLNTEENTSDHQPNNVTSNSPPSTLSSPSSIMPNNQVLSSASVIQNQPNQPNGQQQINIQQQSAQHAAQQGSTGAAGNGANWIPLSASQAKESVFIRMSNKIKALELNLSQSTMYLEEFSLKFRKNMDDVQRAFNRTINKLNETALLAEEKDDRQQEMLEMLQRRLISLQTEVKYLRENDSINWQIIEVHLVLFFIEFSIMISVLLICWRKTTKQLEEKYSCNQPKVRRKLPVQSQHNGQPDFHPSLDHRFNQNDKIFPINDYPNGLKRVNSCPGLVTLIAESMELDILRNRNLRRFGSSKTKEWAPCHLYRY